MLVMFYCSIESLHFEVLTATRLKNKVDNWAILYLMATLHKICMTAYKKKKCLMDMTLNSLPTWFVGRRRHFRV